MTSPTQPSDEAVERACAAYHDVCPDYWPKFVRASDPEIIAERREDMGRALTAAHAELVAEVERLNGSLSQVIEERDRAEECVGDMYNEVIGEHPEWSNAFDYGDALEQVEDHMRTLRHAHQVASAERDEQRQKHYARIVESDRNAVRAEAAERELARREEAGARDAAFMRFARAEMANQTPIKTVSGEDVYFMQLPCKRGAGLDAAIDAAIDSAAERKAK